MYHPETTAAENGLLPSTGEVNPESPSPISESDSTPIVFSEAVDETSAESAGNYSGLPTGSYVVSATLQSGGKTVVIKTSGTDVAAGDTIDISGVSDLNGNTMTAVTDLTLS